MHLVDLDRVSLRYGEDADGTLALQGTTLQVRDGEFVDEVRGGAAHAKVGSDAFLDFAHVQRRKVVAVQLMRHDAELYATRNHLGQPELWSLGRVGGHEEGAEESSQHNRQE